MEAVKPPDSHPEIIRSSKTYLVSEQAKSTAQNHYPMYFMKFCRDL